MKKRSFLIIGIILIIAVLGSYLWFGYLYKDARNVNDEVAAYSLTAEGIAKDYEDGQQNADSKYLNKTIEVKGVVTEVNDSVVTLNGKIFCGFTTMMAEPEGKEVTVKGRCIGYDELFGEVKLDQCSLK